MKNDLFRREVIEAKSGRQLGSISLAQPLGLWWLAAFAVCAAAAVVVLLTFSEYTRRSRVSGQLVPDLGLSIVVAPNSGVVSSVFHLEGDNVSSGDPLVQISTPRTTASGQDTLEAIRDELESRRGSLQRLDESQLEKIDVQIAGASQQLNVLRQELLQIEKAVETREEQIQLGRNTVDRFKSIANLQYVSQVQLDQQLQALLELVNERQSLERQAIAIRRGIAQTEQSLRELPLQREAQKATIQRDRAMLNQERVQHEANSELLMKAPVAGLIATRNVEPGQAVQTGQSLMSLLPKGTKLEAQLLVPSRAIGFVDPGDSVLLRYQAYPYQKFGHFRGRVLRVSRSAMRQSESAALSANAREVEPYYLVRVMLESQYVMAYGKREPLRPGMVLEADILGEHRKLYEWLLEPLYSLRGTVSTP